MSRPEHNPRGATSFYNKKEAAKYQKNNKMRNTQNLLSKRAVELLEIPAGVEGLILDIGCGSGFSHQRLLREGHMVIGLDINRTMLNESVKHTSNRLNRANKVNLSEGFSSKGKKRKQYLEDEAYPSKKRKHMKMDKKQSNNATKNYGIADLVESDMGDGLGFRRNIFDGVISISALQWLCYPSKRHRHKKGKSGNSININSNSFKSNEERYSKKKKKKGKAKNRQAKYTNPHSVEQRVTRFFRKLITHLSSTA